MSENHLLVKNVNSRKVYAVVKRLDGSPLIKDSGGRKQISVVGWREGRRYGPIRWVYADNMEAA